MPAQKAYNKRPHPQEVLLTTRRHFVPRADRRLRRVFAEIGVPHTGGFVPDDFQLEAIKKIEESDVLVSAPTGSGKTWIAVQAIKKILAEGKRAWYASPLKALSNSKYHEFESEFGKENVGVITGDRKENTDASIIVGTTEILRNQLYDAMARASDFKSDLVVLDEAHYLGDRDRGVVWEEVMIYLPSRIRLLLLSATIQNDSEIATWLAQIRNHPCHVVHSETRPVPIYPLYLLPSGELVPLSSFDGISPKIEQYLNTPGKFRLRRYETGILYEHILDTLGTFNLLPAVFFLKSRQECNNALQACRKRSISRERSTAIREKLDEFLMEYAFLADHPQLQHLVHHGIGSHHGGQLPHWKIVIEKMMNAGYLDAIFSTSTVAAGVNFPARTVVLAQSDRFNGRDFVSLTATDLHQAIGRAGRRGKDRIGFAMLVHGPFQDPHLIDRLLATPPEPIESQIKISFSMCLNLMVSQPPEEIKGLVQASFATFQKTDALRSLEERNMIIMDKLAEKMNGCACEDQQTVINRIDSRRTEYQTLTRLRKQRKKHLKVITRSGRPSENDTLLNDLGNEIARIEMRLDEMPCSRCSHFALCHRGKSNHFIKLVDKARLISQAYDEVQNSLWNDFQRHLDFLVLKGFADRDGRLTRDGLWAAKLRLDQPLIIAELIRSGVMNGLTPQLLAGIVAVFVNDKFRDLDIDPTIEWDKKALRSCYYRMKDSIQELVALMKKYGFHVPQMQFWPAAALYTWACAEDWDIVLQLTSVDEGDLAMLVYRTADNLRQLTSLNLTHPELAEKAARSIRLLLREPVVIPTL